MKPKTESYLSNLGSNTNSILIFQLKKKQQKNLKDIFHFSNNPFSTNAGFSFSLTDVKFNTRAKKNLPSTLRNSDTVCTTACPVVMIRQYKNNACFK